MAPRRRASPAAGTAARGRRRGPAPAGPGPSRARTPDRRPAACAVRPPDPCVPHGHEV